MNEAQWRMLVNGIDAVVNDLGGKLRTERKEEVIKRFDKDNLLWELEEFVDWFGGEIS